jgi:FkbM family methyltransferase
MFQVNAITRGLPIEIGITGRKRKVALGILDRVIPLKGLVKCPDQIVLDSANPSQRLLFYCFYNVLRHYRRSPLFRYMQSKLGDNDIFLDIGANLGMYSYLAKKLGCQVYLFEPEPHHAAYLKRNCHIFDQVFDIALSNKEGEFDLYVSSDQNPGGSSLVMSNRGWEESCYSHSVKVKTQRLDDIIADPETIGRIKLAKIDVEGAEEAVVEGMESLLKKKRIDIWCEVRGEKSDRNPCSYLSVAHSLKALDYQPLIYDGEYLAPFSEKHIRQVFDILFVHAGN